MKHFQKNSKQKIESGKLKREKVECGKVTRKNMLKIGVLLWQPNA